MSSCSVTVQVADHLGRLDIVDGSFRAVASGFDSVQAELPPGLYKARASINIAHSEELFTVEPASERLTLTLAPPRFTTPAPLNDTHDATGTLHYQQQALTQATQHRPVDAHLGEGASLLLCVRDIRKPNREHPGAVACGDDDSYRESFGEFSLRTHDGKRRVDVKQHAQPDVERGILIFHVALHPGYYLLSIKTGDGEYLELPVPVCKGWRSALYLQMRPPHCLAQSGHPDLMERSLLFEPMGQAFDPGRRDLRMTEMARLALLRGHDVHLPEQLHAVLRKRIVNPGILLFGAHLLLSETHLDHGLLRRTIEQLADVLGPDFPDVVALRLELAHIHHAPLELPQVGVSLPPVLRASWKLLAGYPQIFPPDSLAHRVGAQFMTSGPWLTWRVLEPLVRAASSAPAVVAADKPYMTVAVAAAAGLLLGRLQYASSDGFFGKANFEPLPSARPTPEDDTEVALRISKRAAKIIDELDLPHWKSGAAGRTVLNRLSRLQKALLPVLQLIEMQQAEGDDFTIDELKQLQQQLGVPMSVFRESVEDLLDKIQAR